MENRNFLNADEVAKELEVSKPTAYKIIRNMNRELSEMGFITIAGRVSKKFFEEKIYVGAKAGNQ